MCSKDPELNLHRRLRSLRWLLGNTWQSCMALSAQRQEQPGSPPMGRPQTAEKAGGAAGGRPGNAWTYQARPKVHPLLAEIVDQIADWDFPDGGVARALRTKALYLIAQYRVPMGTDHHFGSS
jgi:hypothetical protein